MILEIYTKKIISLQAKFLKTKKQQYKHDK